MQDVADVKFLSNFDGSLKDRMGHYESNTGSVLNKKYPVVIRINGRNFKKYSDGFVKPSDPVLVDAMWFSAKSLCAEVQNCRVLYGHSGEMSLLLNANNFEKSQLWYDGNVQRIASNVSAIVTEKFNDRMSHYWDDCGHIRKKTARFDVVCFNLPSREVNNFFVWRQQDGMRNSKISLGEKYNVPIKNMKDVLIMLEDRGIKWSNLPLYQQRGFCCVKNTDDNHWEIDNKIPLFNDDSNYFNKYLR